MVIRNPVQVVCSLYRICVKFIEKSSILDTIDEDMVNAQQTVFIKFTSSSYIIVVNAVVHRFIVALIC